MDFETIACVAIALAVRKRRKVTKKKKKKEARKEERRRVHRYWIHPSISQRFTEGYFHKNYSDMREHPEKFVNYFKMSIESFDKLLGYLRPYITFQDTCFRKAISPEERLTVTLRYLSTGKSISALSMELSMGASTIGEIVDYTCKYLWSCLQPIYMAEKTEDDWLAIAKQYSERTYFPNCVGAIVGKRIRMERPYNVGPGVSNFEKHYMLTLLGIADADCCFSAIDVGAYESGSGSSIFLNSNLSKKLQNGELNLPTAAKIPNYDEGGPLQFVFVGDDAFPLTRHLMRPYPKKTASVLQKIFNNRISYARQTAECAFGILASKWQILQKPLNLKPTRCSFIIKACCILHNYVRKNDGVVQGEGQAEQFKSCATCKSYISIPPLKCRPNLRDRQLRYSFSEYFISPVGEVSWQNDDI